ncbi:hypothetical protein K438DRAFT_1797758 [Mycena galopus ATCC 62051]|nr:hypothetical protein K438DRAFT_1797758 [Mycena galopus ATCC 62051]
MRSLFLLIAAVAFASGAQFDPADTETSQHDLCTVHAWVRAEDLSPDHVSRSASDAACSFRY